MTITQITHRCALVFGGLLILASAMHFFTGYPAIRQLLMQDGAREELYGAVTAIWIFSSITMLGFGLLSLLIASELRKGSRNAWRQGMVIGGGLALFGLIGWFRPFPNWHLFAFLVLGLILVVPLTVGIRRFGNA